MNFKNVLQRAGVIAFSGTMVLSCLAPAAYAWSDADETEYYNKHIENVISWNGKTFEHSGLGPAFKEFPDNPLTCIVRRSVKKPPKAPFFMPVSPKHLVRRNKSLQELTKVSHQVCQTIENPAARPRLIPETLPEPDSRPINLLDSPAQNYLLWKHNFYVRKEDAGKDILPDTAGLNLSTGERAKLDEFIKDGLSYMPKDIRLSIVADFDKVFREAPESERSQVLDSFMSIALSIKSLLCEAASKEDYLRIAYKRYNLKHIRMGPGSINMWSGFKKRMEDDFHAVDKYIQKYVSMLNDHKEEIVQRYKNCGSSTSEILYNLSFKKSIYDFNPCYSMGENHISISYEVCRRTVEENIKSLDPLLKDEIRKDFDAIWTCEDHLEKTNSNDGSGLSRSSEKRDLSLTRLDRTFALCQSIFALKRDLYRAIEKTSRT